MIPEKRFPNYPLMLMFHLNFLELDIHIKLNVFSPILLQSLHNTSISIVTRFFFPFTVLV